MREKVIQFFNDKKDYPILFGLASGLQPLLYLYHKNFNLVNSWPQFLFLTALFIGLPVVLFVIVSFGIKKTILNSQLQSKILSILNLCLFVFFIVFVTYGIHKKKILLLALGVAFITGFVSHKHLKKIVVFQLLLAGLVVLKLIPSLYYKMQYSYDWQKQPDDIEKVVFKKTPNVYYIQPDGYVDFKRLETGYYKHDNSKMQSFLTENNFTIYDDFRSNYRSTLTSNCAILSMKHHYYGLDQNLDRFYNSRKIITGKNPVVEIFKNNSYKTNLILDAPYIVANRPKMLFDYCNIDYSEIDVLPRGFEFEKDTRLALLETMDQNKDSENNFYFVRQPYPGHISTRKATSLGKHAERDKYFEDLNTSNDWLEFVIPEIIKRDADALIIISSDHGGFVGFDYTRESEGKVTDPDLVHSMFSSVLAIRWPDRNVPDYSEALKSTVNIFRVVFSYLGEEDSYLEALQSDASYGLVKEDAPSGAYELISDEGEVVFKRFSN